MLKASAWLFAHSIHSRIGGWIVHRKSGGTNRTPVRCMRDRGRRQRSGCSCSHCESATAKSGRLGARRPNAVCEINTDRHVPVATFPAPTTTITLHDAVDIDTHSTERDKVKSSAGANGAKIFAAGLVRIYLVPSAPPPPPSAAPPLPLLCHRHPVPLPPLPQRTVFASTSSALAAQAKEGA